MIVTYYPHSENTHNLKLQNLKILENSNYVSKFQISRVLPHVNGV